MSNKIWKLWIDVDANNPDKPDCHCPNGTKWDDDWMVATSSEIAIALIKENGAPYFIDFEYNLGGSDTSKSICEYLKANFPNNEILYRVRSENIEGKKWIETFMDTWMDKLL